MLRYKVSSLTLEHFRCYNLNMGRPKKPPAESKTYMLRVRMTAEERDILEQAAKAKSLQLSSWVRSEMLALARVLVGTDGKPPGTN